MLQGKLLRRRAGPQATVSWVLDQVAATEGLTVTLEAVGKAKASKGQCPDSKLLGFELLRFKDVKYQFLCNNRIAVLHDFEFRRQEKKDGGGNPGPNLDPQRIG